MFIRRHYYELTNGRTLWTYMASGTLVARSVEEELAAVPELKNRAPETIGTMEWLEPVEDIEAKFNGAYDVAVDISATPHALVFTERPKPEPIPEDEQPATAADYEAALEALGV